MQVCCVPFSPLHCTQAGAEARLELSDLCSVYHHQLVPADLTAACTALPAKHTAFCCPARVLQLPISRGSGQVRCPCPLSALGTFCRRVVGLLALLTHVQRAACLKKLHSINICTALSSCDPPVPLSCMTQSIGSVSYGTPLPSFVETCVLLHLYACLYSQSISFVSVANEQRQCQELWHVLCCIRDMFLQYLCMECSACKHLPCCCAPPAPVNLASTSL